MSINNMELVTILVYILAGLFLLQAIITLIMYFALQRPIKKAEDKAITLTQRSAGQIRNLKALLFRLNKSLDRLPMVEQSVSRVLDYAIGKLQLVNQYTESALRKSSDQIEEIGRQFEHSLKQFSRQTAQVDRAIRNPAVNASALLQGLVVGFKELFKSTPPVQPATHSPDDDAFI
jgi:hypothetical protein